MLSYCLLLTLVLGAVSADFTKVTCNSMTPLKDASVSSLSGNWVAVKSVAFNSGVPFNPANPDEDPRTKTCIHATGYDSTDNSIKVKNVAHITGRDPITETLSLTVVGSEKGRMSMKSDIQDRENWEFMVIEADPAKYLVYVLCQPPNEAGERLPERVNLMSRHEDHSDHEVLTAEEIEAVYTSVAGKIGIAGQGVKPVSYARSCWTAFPN
ncbi:hypothetical protein B566_EDAN006108 [Ephemera danica]|nr:hypothetical protein B566_EDAN006108 [Ephemera danica]